MSWLGVQPLKKFNAPFLKPYWPFFAAAINPDAGVVIAYGVNSAQNAMMNYITAAEFKNDPRNPNAKTGGH
ncbi:unnamed protein product [Fusarium graminearum]|nr:hypothetical protein HG531_008815 [Fusarium graminearum]CAF3540823.1 unnamed protein product [Fusarium graminearum]CAG1995947.1 unnamed protein product [Fusarium graminearum]CAG2006675.1 unnamed protein product [Fusarium graminearum]VTO88507.1 unnamed protein product [Fusarium graminearum]